MNTFSKNKQNMSPALGENNNFMRYNEDCYVFKVNVFLMSHLMATINLEPGTFT